MTVWRKILKTHREALWKGCARPVVTSCPEAASPVAASPEAAEENASVSRNQMPPGQWLHWHLHPPGSQMVTG